MKRYINHDQYSLLKRVRFSVVGMSDPGQMRATAEMMENPVAKEALATGWISAEPDGDTFIVTLTAEGRSVLTERDDA